MKNVRIIVVSALLLLLAGCVVKESVSVERASASTQIERVLADSIVMRDSIIIREKCDTVFFTKYRTLYKERIRHDTVVRCDTVYAERSVTVEKSDAGKALWWLLLPVVAVLWKVGLFDLLRKIILKI
ncbi:MAG: hypothetical protein IKA52_02425 [Bacteroidaceae bacterium]|nr:hypothetical protein [Bacteroidaceae bacterium]